MTSTRNVTFNKKQKTDFFPVVRKRVNTYFKENGVSMNANLEMKFKVIFILSGFFACYFMLISNSFVFSPMLMLFLACGFGFFSALIGLNIGHDAIHGAFSNNKTVNRLMGVWFNVIGANDHVWNISHNLVHHTYTNIPDHDDDINQIPILRLNPQQELWKIHRFQFIYAWFLYPLASITWVFMKDYKKFFSENIGNHVNQHPKKEYFRLFFFKAIHYLMYVVIPFLIIDMPWWQILIGFIIGHLVMGFTISSVFQLAHVVEGPEFPIPDENGFIENSWAIHQMHTTANFSRKSRVVDFIFGGLNFQIEHHLFPYICHTHYKDIAHIVKATAKEYNVPYYENESFLSAVKSHIKELKVMGTPAVA